MNKLPLVSVIMPVFNRETLISRAIKSVLDQTYNNIELFVIDDGSSDGTRLVCEGFVGDSRFHYFFQENSGQSAARNLGIKKSRGEFIAFLDSDNYWSLNKIESQISFFYNNPNFDILYSDIIPIDEHGNRLQRKTFKKFSGRILNNLLCYNFVTNNTALVRRKCFDELGGFDESLRCAEDYDLWLRFAVRYRFLHHPEAVTYYCCEGEGRLSSQEEKVLNANIKIVSRFFDQYPHVVPLWIKNRAWSGLYIWKIQFQLYLGVRPNRLEIMKAVGLNPLDIRGWKILAKVFLT